MGVEAKRDCTTAYGEVMACAVAMICCSRGRKRLVVLVGRMLRSGSESDARQEWGSTMPPGIGRVDPRKTGASIWEVRALPLTNDRDNEGDRMVVRTVWSSLAYIGNAN